MFKSILINYFQISKYYSNFDRHLSGIEKWFVKITIE